MEHYEVQKTLRVADVLRWLRLFQVSISQPAKPSTGGQVSMKHQNAIRPAGLLLLVLLRQAHTRLPHSRTRKLSTGRGEQIPLGRKS
jgi:hypothetical protein